MFLIRKHSSTSNTLRVMLRNSTTGAGLTGLTSASSGLIISTIADVEASATSYTAAGSTIETISTLGTFAAPTATKVRFKEVDATNHPGLYELQIADARFSVSNAKALRIAISGATSLIAKDVTLQLSKFDPDDAVRAGLSALPNANAEAAGGLYTRGTGTGQINQPADGMVDANVVRNAGTAITSAAGVQEVKVASIAANALTATAIAADAITAAKVAADVTAEIQSGLATAANLATVASYIDTEVAAIKAVTDQLPDGGALTSLGDSAADVAAAVWDYLVSAATTSGSMGKRIVDFLTGDAYARLGAPAGASVSADVAAVKVDTAAILDDTGTAGVVVASASKTGYALSSAGIQAIWDALTSALTTVGSIGKLLVDNINATISSRLPTSSYTAPPSAASIADQVWEEILADHSGTSGSTAAALNAAGSAGDPWNTALPGAYGAGSAGKIIGDNLNATVGSRAPESGGNVAAIKAQTDNLPPDPADQSLVIAATTAIYDRLGAPAGASLAADLAALPAAVWASGTRTLSSFGTLVADIATAVWGAATRLLTAGTNIVLAKGTGVTGFNDPTSTATATAVRTELTTELGRMDTAVSTRATPAQVTTALNTYDAPTKAELDAAVALLATAASLATLDARFTANRSEPGQGAPSASTTALAKLDFLYKIARNKLEQTSTEFRVYNDAGDTIDHKATVSDDGSIYTREEIGTGA